MPPVGFEPVIPAGERLQTHALECIKQSPMKMWLRWT
jgi:hypothetical protein